MTRFVVAATAALASMSVSVGRAQEQAAGPRVATDRILVRFRPGYAEPDVPRSTAGRHRPLFALGFAFLVREALNAARNGRAAAGRGAS
jgi:hypothetical protein